MSTVGAPEDPPPLVASGDQHAVPRRTILQGLATALAGTAVLPGSASAVAQAPVAAAGTSPPTSEQPSTRFLTAHELETLGRIGDQLVPGSTAAGVPALADRVLGVETGEVQRRFRNALGAFEHEARQRHAKPWIELGSGEQAGILDAAASTPSSRSERRAWKKGEPVSSPEPPPTARPASLHDHLVHLRDFVAGIYYSTEAGMRELGWEGNVFWDALPGCGDKA
jgi:hypothetical protein